MSETSVFSQLEYSMEMKSVCVCSMMYLSNARVERDVKLIYNYKLRSHTQDMNELKDLIHPVNADHIYTCSEKNEISVISILPNPVQNYETNFTSYCFRFYVGEQFRPTRHRIHQTIHRMDGRYAA